jgi:hypothetical protein
MSDLRIARIAARQAAQTAASRLAVLPLLDAEATTDEQVAAVVDLFDGFDADKRVYKVGDIVGFDGVPYRCVQAHTSQADWTPDKVPALWAPVRKVAGAAPDEWAQPVGASDAYALGDRVTFQGQVWESTIDANVWSPTAYPAGWAKV